MKKTATVSLLLACSCVTGATRQSIDRLGENLVKAADSVDPLVLKELYRDVKTLDELNERLEEKLRVLQAGVRTEDSVEVVVNCDDQPDAGGTIAAYLQQAKFDRKGNIDWGEPESLVSTNCGRAPAKAVLNKNTRRPGRYRISWKVSLEGPRDNSRHNACVVVSFASKGAQVGESTVHNCCAAGHGESCRKMQSDKVEERSVEVFLRGK